MSNEELYQLLTDFIGERVDGSIMNLEKQKFYKDTKKLKEDLFEEICKDICYQDFEKIEKIENFIGESAILNSYHEDTYYLCGVLDGIKFLNLFAKIV